MWPKSCSVSLGNGWFLRLLVSCHLFSPPSIWKSPWEAAWQDDRSIFIEESGETERPVLVIFKNWQWFSRVQLNSFMLPLMWHEPDHIPVLPLEKKESKSHLPTKYNLETWFLHFWNQMIRAYDLSRMRILPGSLNRAQLFL